MKKLIILLCGLCWPGIFFALSGQAYMDRFNTYTVWNKNLPITPTQEFLDFVKESTPLSNKLREKWLYEFEENI